MNWLDFVLAGSLAVGAWQGFRHGLVREVSGLLGFALAIFLGFHYLEPAGTFITDTLGIGGDIVPFLAFLLVFGVVMAVVSGVVKGIEIILKITLLSIPNRILGGLFGLVKGAVLGSLLLQLGGFFGQPPPATREASLLHPIVAPFAPAAYNLFAVVVPGSAYFQEDLKEALKQLETLAND